jgi:hypothetical protein
MWSKVLALGIVLVGAFGAYLAQRDQWVLAVVLIVLPLLLAVGSFFVGRAVLVGQPVAGGWMVDLAVRAGIGTVGAAATAVLLYMSIEYAPNSKTNPSGAALWAAVATAVGGVITAWLVEPKDDDIWNPLKELTKSTFKGQFALARWPSASLSIDDDHVREDADHALMDDPPSGYKTPLEAGWAWSSRRRRMKAIQLALDTPALWTSVTKPGS